MGRFHYRADGTGHQHGDDVTSIDADRLAGLDAPVSLVDQVCARMSSLAAHV